MRAASGSTPMCSSILWRFALNTMRATVRNLAPAHRTNQRDRPADTRNQWRNQRGPQTVRWWAWFGFDWRPRLDRATRPNERDCCAAYITHLLTSFATGLHAAVAMAVGVLMTWPHPFGFKKGISKANRHFVEGSSTSFGDCSDRIDLLQPRSGAIKASASAMCGRCARPWLCCMTGKARWRRSSKPGLARCCGAAARSPGKPAPAPSTNLGSWPA